MTNRFIITLFLLVISLKSIFAQEYINSANLMRSIEKQLNQPSFDTTALNKMYENIHAVKELKKVAIKLEKKERKQLSAEAIFEKTYPSVFMFIQVYKDKNGMRKVNGAGTAFPISADGYFIVNKHMVNEFGIGSGDPTKVNKELKVMLSSNTGDLYYIDSIVTYSGEADIAILKADLKGDKIKPFALGDDLKTGAEVFVLSHPKNYIYYFSAGRIARFTEAGNRGLFSRKMEITADYAAGSSGGPIIDNKGNIAGLVSSTRSFYYDQANQKNLQMVVKETIPVSTIKGLLNP